MLLHSVYFRLRPDLSQARRDAFWAGLESLRPIASARTVYIGRPAPVAPRPVVCQDYDFALIVLFEDVAAHDAYQTDPLHRTFLARFKDEWEAVRIYDVEQA